MKRFSSCDENSLRRYYFILLGSQKGTFEIIYPIVSFILKINLFKYLLSSYYVPGTALNNGKYRHP